MADERSRWEFEGQEAFTAIFDQELAREVSLGHTACILRLHLVKAAQEALAYCNEKGLEPDADCNPLTFLGAFAQAGEIVIEEIDWTTF